MKLLLTKILKNMKITITILFLFFSMSSFSQITVQKLVGSSVVTDLGMGIKVNKGSTLKRENVILNDTSCPILLSDNVSIETAYTERSYAFKANGSISIKEPIVAFEINYVLYDIFGEHIKTLSSTEVSDMENTLDLLKKGGSWYASENNVSEYYICVAYVANVRTKSGQLWHYNFKTIKDELVKLKISFQDEYLPKKDSNNQK